MDWKTLEPIFITSLIGLVGWALIEISNLRVSSAKIQTEILYVKDDLTQIKNDLKIIRKETVLIDPYSESIIKKPVNFEN